MTNISLRSLWNGILLLGFVFLQYNGAAQATVSVSISQDTVSIGDQIFIDYIIKVPEITNIEALDLSSLDSTDNLAFTQDQENLDEFLDWTNISLSSNLSLNQDRLISLDGLKAQKEGGSNIYKFTQSIAVFSVGIFDIPPPSLRTSVALNTIPLERPRLLVNFPKTMLEKDSLSLQPIKPIIETGISIEDFLPYFYGILALLVFGFLSKRIFDNKGRNDQVEEMEEEIIQPAHIIALEGLESLKEERIWEQGKIKTYQSRLTDIIRTYLENRFEVKALEMTTDEISRALMKTQFDAKHESRLKEILQIADLIKFAKAKPDESIHERFLNNAIQFVKDTKLETLEDQ